MTPDMSNSDAVRFSVLKMVQDNPNITQREVAERLGISLGRVNYCIAALVDKGFIKVENFRAANNKWRYIYVLTPTGISERAALTGRFLARKLREFDQIKAEIDALSNEVVNAPGKHGVDG